jgi:hypothetical protein
VIDRLRRTPLGLLVVALTLSPGFVLAKGDARKVDLIWVAPDYGTTGPRSIAFMPPVSWNNDLPSEHATEDAAAAALRSLPYRWLSPSTVLSLLEARPVADSIWKAQRAVLVRNARIDSLAAPVLCAALRTRALLCFRVDQLERHDLAWDESGSPTTAVQVHAALIDSTGRMLWTASGSEVGSGASQDGASGMTRVDASGLNNSPSTGTGKSPEPRDVLAKLFVRWAERFPAPPAAGAP